MFKINMIQVLTLSLNVKVFENYESCTYKLYFNSIIF